MTHGNRAPDKPLPDIPLPTNIQQIAQIAKEIIEDRNIHKLVTTAEALGIRLVRNGLATNQIRNVFGTVRQIQADWPLPEFPKAEGKDRRMVQREFVLLKPKLFYQSKRVPAVELLRDWLIPMIDLVVPVQALAEKQEYERFTAFVEFFEATLAYHTAYGGKERDDKRK